MSDVLLIPSVGPMQSWGTRSRFRERDTEREPSKSGVIGLLCAALGWDRVLNEFDGITLNELAVLKMGTRADQEGLLKRDYQTALDIITADGKISKDAQISNRYYLADAAFLVGLEGDEKLLRQLHTALENPVWPLFLGRKSYVPSLPLYMPDGLCTATTLRDAFITYPLLPGTKNQENIRFVLESELPTHESRMDSPISFALGRREFRERFVKTEFIAVKHFRKREDENVPFIAQT